MPVRWRRVILFAVLGAVWAGGFTLVHLDRTYDELGPLVDTRPDRPAAHLVQQDIPGIVMTLAGEHDGAMYYAIARQPFAFVETSQYLDDPSYRYGRITLPLLAFLLHPTGGGQGLIWALFAVGVVGALVGGIAMGGISMSLGGPAWPALVFGLLPGVWISLRQSNPDVLATGLVLLAVLLLLRDRPGWAIVAGTAGVLSKESLAVVLLGVALSRRDRTTWGFALIPIGIALAWRLAMRAALPGGWGTNQSLQPPLSGWVRAFPYWLEGAWPLGFISAVGGVAAAVYALVRYRLGHLFSWSILLSLGLAVFYHADVTLQDANAPRTYLPLWCCVILVLFARPAAETAPVEPVTADAPTPTPGRG